MISDKTIVFLDEFCDFSDRIFQDGGANYIFKYGRKLAHYLQEKQDIHMTFTKELNQNHLKQLHAFIDRAHGDIEKENPSDENIKKSMILLELLQIDINYDHVYIANYLTNDYTSELKIVMIKGNDYYSLELMWSLD